MKFNEHSNLDGLHAFLGASKHSWINYDDNQLIESYQKALAKTRGTELHEFAAQCIKLGVKLQRTNKTLNMYVNDAIGYNMTPEQPLIYSVNCFGTADAISFRKNLLRIHDLKTGVTKASMSQLEIYAALFCLEYDIEPNDIDMELRIYQSNEIVIHHPEKEDILYIREKIKRFDILIEQIKNEEGEL